VLALDPHNVSALYWRARAYSHVSEPDKALIDCQEALRLAPALPRCRDSVRAYCTTVNPAVEWSSLSIAVAVTAMGFRHGGRPELRVRRFRLIANAVRPHTCRNKAACP